MNLGHWKAELKVNMSKKDNEKFSLTLYISLLPIVILVLLILGAGYFLTEGEFKLPSSDEFSARSVEGFPTTVLTTNVLDKQREIISSQEELDAFLARIDSAGQIKVNDSINFNKEVVLAVTTETLDTDGYKLKVDKLYNDTDDNKIVVKLLLTEPGETCEVESATNVAVDLVAIKKTDKQIDFERFKRTKECN